MQRAHTQDAIGEPTGSEEVSRTNKLLLLKRQPSWEKQRSKRNKTNVKKTTKPPGRTRYLPQRLKPIIDRTETSQEKPFFKK